MTSRPDVSSLKAILYSDVRPDENQTRRFQNFIEKKYGPGVEFTWEQSDKYPSGFRMEVGADIYDWSVEGRLKQLQDALSKIDGKSGEVIPLIRDTLKDWEPQIIAEEVGTVVTLGDGNVTVKGLGNATYGEILVFSDGTRGMVQDIKEDVLGCILFSDEGSITAGSPVYRTNKSAGIPVGDAFLGRVIDALGSPIDGLGEIQADDYYPVETEAPGIIMRQPVKTPLETGILSIDSMFPIGRGQRELIIGDRQTGKTAIALDTIINQKGKNCICIYVAIGQKTSSVVQFTETLKKHGAMDYSIVMSASASDAAPLQYIAPYAGCALAEYFMHNGKDVLIVYDDLSKHAVAYRALSLLLERAPGREAYPGDVFYLHSRLLERSARLSDEYGGGSITALPIIETQAGDVSAYIPTNVISITDGQIFLETNLFFAGQRPAVNVGLSVSRVGGDAQTKAMKKAAGSLRVDLAQYREMEVFTQFASDLGEETKNQLIYGQGLMRLLRQPQYQPKAMHEQIITLVAALAHVMQPVPVDSIPDFTRKMLDMFEKDHPEIADTINSTGVLDDDVKESIIRIARDFRTGYLA